MVPPNVTIEVTLELLYYYLMTNLLPLPFLRVNSSKCFAVCGGRKLAADAPNPSVCARAVAPSQS